LTSFAFSCYTLPLFARRSVAEQYDSVFIAWRNLAMQSLLFQTTYRFTTREDKAKYVWLKYKTILKGKILDIGADQGFLRSYLPEESEYITVGLEPHHDVQIDLEKPIPIEDNSYDCVLCLDVLEHIENVHQLFDDLCRITRRYLVVSLPNAWRGFLGLLRYGYYSADRPMKFYNLPVDPPKDRHRWFFSPSEARNFLETRGGRNGMEVLQADQIQPKFWKRAIYGFLLSLVIHKSIAVSDLVDGTLWVVLEKKPNTTTPA
jgi:hypothetical protein